MFFKGNNITITHFLPTTYAGSLLIRCTSNEMIWGWYKKSPNGNLINIKSNVFKETFLRAPSSEIEYFKYKIEFFTIQDGIRTVNGSNLIIKNFQSSDFSTYLCMDLSYRFVESQFIKLSKTFIAYRERCLHLKGSILFLFKASPTCPISRCVCNYTNELNCANKNLRNLDEILYASKESLLNISIFDLASNQLSFLSRDVFSSLSNLIQLKFSFNKKPLTSYVFKIFLKYYFRLKGRKN